MVVEFEPHGFEAVPPAVKMISFNAEGAWQIVSRSPGQRPQSRNQTRAVGRGRADEKKHIRVMEGVFQLMINYAILNSSLLGALVKLLEALGASKHRPGLPG